MPTDNYKLSRQHLDTGNYIASATGVRCRLTRRNHNQNEPDFVVRRRHSGAVVNDASGGRGIFAVGSAVETKIQSTQAFLFLHDAVSFGRGSSRELARIAGGATA